METVVGVFAHVDAGKTTLSEQLLYRGGTLRRAWAMAATAAGSRPGGGGCRSGAPSPSHHNSRGAGEGKAAALRSSSSSQPWPHHSEGSAAA